MDRRGFIKTGATMVAVASIAKLEAEAAIPALVNAVSADAKAAEDAPVASAERIKVRFLGTGAADWKEPDPKTGEFRRNSSVLINGELLIDFTQKAGEMLPKGFVPSAIFYTHSHADHFDPEAALKLGIKKAYVGETWIDRARKDFEKASESSGIPMIELIPVTVGEKYSEAGLVLTPVPANHATNDLKEQTLIYLLESTDARLLYATDTAGIMGVAARYCGIDAHRNGKAITGLIMEATMGVDHTDDFRIYSHSSVATVAQTVRVLKMTNRYQPRKGTNVWITHMARTLHGTQSQIDAKLPTPLKAAWDGLEVEF